MIGEKERVAVAVSHAGRGTLTAGWLAWPRSGWLFAILLLALYWPALMWTGRLWLTRDAYSHCVYILPISLFVVWLRRKEIREALVQPSAWGFIPLALGLTIYSAAYLLRLEMFLMWTLIPVLAGGILVLHGPGLWRITRFAVLFLVFAAPIPYPVEDQLNEWLKSITSFCTAGLVSAMGFTLDRQGNLLEVPGALLEVADGCSGYKKFIAMVAFASLYSYLFAISNRKRAALLLLSMPIAIVANVIRVVGLTLAVMIGGVPLFEQVHDWAERSVLVIAFVLFILVGKAIGCKRLRFMPSRDSS
jgi:exosortase